MKGEVQREKRETFRNYSSRSSRRSLPILGLFHADIRRMFEENLSSTLKYACACLGVDGCRQVCPRVLVCVRACVRVYKVGLPIGLGGVALVCLFSTGSDVQVRGKVQVGLEWGMDSKQRQGSTPTCTLLKSLSKSSKR